MTGRSRIAIAAGLIAAVVAAWALVPGFAADGKKLKIGDAAPTWSGIIGTDDAKHGLADYTKADLVVLVFTCNTCPVARAYEDRLIAIQDDYKDKGVQVIAVNSNSPKVQPQDSLEKMKQRAEGKDLGDWRQSKKAFSFPYLCDAAQTMARDYGATCTPHVFLLDKDRKLVYTGRIDDSQPPAKVKKQDLRAALDALVAGKAPPMTVTTQFGCTIKWD
jgi:peroxiredoxin